MTKPSDQRAYVKIAVQLPDHPKVAALDDPIASWAHIVAICYCGEHLTDGIFPVAAILRKSGASKVKADKLFRAPLWHKPGHDCEGCPQPPSGHAVIHDYLEHQHSEAYIRNVSATKAAAGRRGAAKRWQNNGTSHSTRHDTCRSTSVADDVAGEWHTDSMNDGTAMAEVRSKNLGVKKGGNRPVSNARANATEPPPTAPTSGNRPDERCSRHHDLTTDPGPCRGCMRAREHAEQWDRDQHLNAIMVTRNCGLCDADGWRYELGSRVPMSPYTKCDHRPLIRSAS